MLAHGHSRRQCGEMVQGCCGIGQLWQRSGIEACGRMRHLATMTRPPSRPLKTLGQLVLLSTHQPCKGQLADEEVGAALVSPDLSQRHCAWAEPVRLLCTPWTTAGRHHHTRRQRCMQAAQCK